MENIKIKEEIHSPEHSIDYLEFNDKNGPPCKYDFINKVKEEVDFENYVEEKNEQIAKIELGTEINTCIQSGANLNIIQEEEQKFESNEAVKIELVPVKIPPKNKFSCFNVKNEKVFISSDYLNISTTLSSTDEAITEQEKIVDNHTDKKQYKCKICVKEFKQKYGLKQHIRYYHSDKKEFKCKICDKEFKLKQNLKSHINVHSDSKEYECDTCNKEFKRKSGLKIHIRYYHSDKKEYKCAICDKEFKHKCSLKKHIIDYHSGKKEYKCDKCNKEFKRKCGLKNHIRYYHSDRKEFTCDICDKEFKQKCGLRYHIRYYHSDKKEYKCAICDKEFKHKCSLKKHIIYYHSGKKEYKCEICDMKFINNCFLKAHTDVHKGTKYKYDRFGNQYSYKTSVKHHLLNCSRKKKNLISSGVEYFECERCFFKFKTLSHLNIHRNSYDLKVSLTKVNYLPK